MCLINQIPARNQNFVQNNQLIQIRQGGLDKSSPYKKIPHQFKIEKGVLDINQTPV